MTIVRVLFALLLGFILGVGTTVWMLQSGAGVAILRAVKDHLSAAKAGIRRLIYKRRYEWGPLADMCAELAIRPAASSRTWWRAPGAWKGRSPISSGGSTICSASSTSGGGPAPRRDGYQRGPAAPIAASLTSRHTPRAPTIGGSSGCPRSAGPGDQSASAQSQLPA